MGWTKRQIVGKAFSTCGLQNYEFDIQPEESQDALSSLDSMMAEWDFKGIRLGYALPGSPDDSELDTDSGLPDYAVKTVYLNLAILIAPGLGKTIQPATVISARQGYDQLLIKAAYPQRQQLPNTLPRGAGNRHFGVEGYPFFPTPSNDQLPVTSGGDLDIVEP